MLSLPPSVRIFLATQPADLRRSFDGLAALVRDFLNNRAAFTVNGVRDRLKVLYWDRDGLAIWYKRLEEGTFDFPAAEASGRIEIRAAELTMLLDGVDWDSVRRRHRYRRPAPA